MLESAGISSPKAVMIMYTGKKKTLEAVQRTRLAFPAVILSPSIYMGAYILPIIVEGLSDPYHPLFG